MAAAPATGRLKVSARREYFLREDGHPFEAVLPWAGPGLVAPLVSRWVFLSAQLERSGATFVPAHLAKALRAIEERIVVYSGKIRKDELAPFARLLTLDERALVRATLLPRLSDLGLEGPGLAAVARLG
jgi:hypothetical protein